MDKAKTISEGWGLPPPRSFKDFLSEVSRFQLPNFKDFEKWGNRVANNLIYYQTNYLLTSIIIVLLVGLTNPTKMLYGLLAMSVIWIQYVFVFYETEGMIYEIKRQYPKLQSILLVISACYAIYNINSILLVLFSLLLSIGVTFIHASLRLRNLKNKLANKIEGIGLNTPMGVFLKYFGMKEEFLT